MSGSAVKDHGHSVSANAARRLTDHQTCPNALDVSLRRQKIVTLEGLAADCVSIKVRQLTLVDGLERLEGQGHDCHGLLPGVGRGL